MERQEDHTPKLWMVHKTRNELVTRDDPQGRATVFDRLAKLKMPDTLMPVVRNGGSGRFTVEFSLCLGALQAAVHLCYYGGA